jgi:transcription antitermination factor NusG
LSSGHQWFAVYTRSRHEKVVHEALAGQAIEAFLPLREVLREWSDRRKWVEVPLFPGYLFTRLEMQDLWRVQGTRGVVDLVGDGRRPVPIPDDEIVSLRQLVERPVPVDPWPYICEGDLVVVKAGPLIGIQGFFVERRGNGRLVLSVELLGRSVAAEVGAACVEPVDPRAVRRPQPSGLLPQGRGVASSRAADARRRQFH